MEMKAHLDVRLLVEERERWRVESFEYHGMFQFKEER